MPFRFRLAFAFPLAAIVLAGCAGEAPVDVDPIRDARSESGDDEDTGSTHGDDTGLGFEDASSDDVGFEDSGVDTGRPDTSLTCTGSEPEPNNSQPSARQLKEIDDCDGSGGSFKGVVAGGSDTDFWHYKGNDKIGCVADPSASTTSANVRLCVFVMCAAGPTELEECEKGVKTTIGGGVNGCCVNGPGEVEVNYKCTLVGTSDSADVYMRLDAPDATACVPYDVSYHF